MQGATTEFKRLLLRGIGWDAQKAGIRLRAALQAACQARLSENKSGLALVGTSGNGASITFALPQTASRLSPETVVEAVSNLYDRYEEALSELGTDEVTATDDAIQARMLLLLVRRNECYSDRSGMHMGMRL